MRLTRSSEYDLALITETDEAFRATLRAGLAPANPAYPAKDAAQPATARNSRRFGLTLYSRYGKIEAFLQR